MAGPAASSSMSFPEYTFDLSERLRAVARSTLAEFEASINNDGYNWLDSYMENIQAQGRSAPIADLIKTPSRTATSKKTRAAMTATLNRAEQVKAFNARLALSPLADRSPAGRQPFSPLQAQSLNSPRRLAVPDATSPSKSPFGGKVSKLQLKPKDKGKAKDVEPPAAAPKKESKSKGKGKAKAKVDDENVDEGDKPPPKKRGRPKKVALDDSTASKESSVKALRSAAPKAPSPEPQAIEPEPEAAPEPSPEPEVVDAPADEPAEAIVVDGHEVVAESESAVKEPELVEDGRIEVDESEVADDKCNDKAVAADDKHEDEAEAMEVDAGVVAPDADTDVGESDTDQIIAQAPPSPSPVKKAATPLKMISPIKKASPITMDSPTKTAQPAKEPTKSSSPVKAAEPAEPAAPARQVRSSWLNQALGNRPVPMNARTSTLGDAPIRKSLMAGSSLKRKSEDGPGADADDKHGAKRAEKVARFDSQATDAATGQPASPVRSSIFAARQPGSATSLPAAAVGTPGAAAARNPTSVPATKADKVSRALEELRERTAAAAAAKQKSAAANKLANATKEPVAQSSSGGFLRGLGNLGAGLFGLGSSIEDAEAQRRREEENRRAQEKAEEDLARIMSEMAESDRKAMSKSPQPTSEAASEPTLKRKSKSKSPEPIRKTRKSKSKSPPIRQPSKVFPTSEAESDQMGDVAIVVDDDDEDADDESDHSVTLPELPTPDIGDDYDDEPFEDGPTSALGAAGINFNFDSTTPPNTPPLKIKRAPKVQTPQIIVSPPPKEAGKPALKKSNLGQAVRTNISRPASPTDYEYDDDDVDMDDEDDTMSVRSMKKPAAKGRVVSGASSKSSRSSVLSQAERMAAKSLGVKPATGPVASLQRAAEAAKKEESANERKAALRAQIERRKQEEARRKEEAERIAAEEERKRKAAEMEERRKRLAEAEKRRQEREERTLQMAKEKAAREEREAAEARAKAAEEEAARKRKMAALLSKSQAPSATASNSGTIKRIAQPASTPGPKSLRPSNLTKTPSTFRDEHTTSTIKLVSKTAVQRTSNATTSSYTSSAQALQASRQHLQAQLDAKVEVSEDIVLPDIASEYSDSDDSEKETDFKRPAWAESPELKSALERQATLNPDELFGAIRPLNMDELFKQRQGKFRARTSSANWSGADRLTEAEEREYARRMGFKPLHAPREGGSSAGDR